ncbi:lipid asymmetry maintenance protein MlaB [Candidatus Erwinia haradaeae]|uniref:Intermembrane phospholipid transport system binding protein MlaB n=1 Tax=Candidatus Erwinia haradaeae TaxID=1922217 RepID=A0A451D9I5_9GAMM|nr:lipid asymmetry maintenance protein MlaB [Candidatus Erwinia haradaeae]VFP82973.1 Intermembrane phospholipid transport system binding protein MlaB [Candidatus Erwinia haradaeae]
MSTQLEWEVNHKNLYLRGELTYKTLRPLWSMREKVMQCIENINVCKLTRVDTGGLAFLIHLQYMSIQNGKALCFSGITPQLYALITLYHLQNIITRPS